MKLLALGVDHRSAPTSLRETLAFQDSRRIEALSELKELCPGVEFVILSTCNRVELYMASTSSSVAPEVELLTEWLVRFHRVPPLQLASHLVAHHDEAVIGHLFRVASGLESLVLGEGQILGQVRDAYQAAVASSAVGPALHLLFQQAIRVGKQVREQTGLGQGRLSVASIAVDLARDVFDHFDDKTVLVIGAGKMGELTLQHLSGLKPGRILITNRNDERASAVAQRWRAQPIAFELLGQALIQADVVVSTTAAEEPIVTLEMYSRVQRARRNRLALILDIAVPRDFEERIGELDQVLLYNVDDLQKQVQRNLENRQRGIDPAQTIIERETLACLSALEHRQSAGVVLQELGALADSVRTRELEKLFALCPDLTESQRAAVTQFACRFQNQFLHHPRAALRNAANQMETAHHGSLLSAVRHLFGLVREDRGITVHEAVPLPAAETTGKPGGLSGAC